MTRENDIPVGRMIFVDAGGICFEDIYDDNGERVGREQMSDSDSKRHRRSFSAADDSKHAGAVADIDDLVQQSTDLVQNKNKIAAASAHVPVALAPPPTDGDESDASPEEPNAETDQVTNNQDSEEESDDDLNEANVPTMVVAQ
jgi:hypothetical protein